MRNGGLTDPVLCSTAPAPAPAPARARLLPFRPPSPIHMPISSIPGFFLCFAAVPCSVCEVRIRIRIGPSLRVTQPTSTDLRACSYVVYCTLYCTIRVGAMQCNGSLSRLGNDDDPPRIRDIETSRHRGIEIRRWNPRGGLRSGFGKGKDRSRKEKHYGR